jgi:hypothetical protein
MVYVGRDVAVSLDAVFLHAIVGLAAVNLEDCCPRVDLEFESASGAKSDHAIETWLSVDAPGEQA